MFLEDLIMAHCQDLFKGLTIVDMVPFRITRDSDLEVEEDATQDLMKEIETVLRGNGKEGRPSGWKSTPQTASSCKNS